MHTVDFPERLTTLRRQRDLTQQQLADHIDLHVSQLRRYEQGKSQPTLDVIRRLALALNTTADQLVFDNETDTTTDHMWQLRLEALTHLDPDEQAAIRTLIDSILLRHQARKLAS
jgi:transcriptional regulator with XRE-family HTH domain